MAWRRTKKPGEKNVIGHIRAGLEEGWDRASSRDSGLNLLLLTYDSCRYDVLAEAQTPVLDSYSEIVCASTPASYTFAAHQSFFAGLLPNAVTIDRPYYNRFNKQLLGLREKGEEPRRKGTLLSVASEVNAVAGLSQIGYQTVGAGAMNWFRQRSLIDCFAEFLFTGTDAEAQIDFLLSKLDVSRPFFGFVNFGETHYPYYYKGKEGECPVRVSPRVMSFPPVESGPVGKECAAYAHQVEAAEFLDRQLPRLFEALPGDTVVILCGDHGECFGEDGYWGHGVEHPKVFEVPLSIFRLDRQPLS